MSTLTKICVVILVVLVLIASAVFTRQAVTGPNYRDALKKSQHATELAQIGAATAHLEGDVARSGMQDAENKLLNAQRETRKAQEAERDAKAQAAAQQREYEAKIQSLELTLERMQNTLGTSANLLASYTKKNDTMRESMEKTTQENVRLSSLLDQETAKVIQANEIIKVAQERIATLSGENRELRTMLKEHGVTANAKGTATGTTSEATITGTLTAVRDNNIASINIGTAKGVHKGMKFYIYRGGVQSPTFVGYLTVDEVEAGEAAGIITDTRVKPMRGDKVTNRLD